MNVVDVEQVTKVYQTSLKRGNVVALNEVSLSIHQGEIFGLLGPNGAGKTTLMKAILGITRPTSGRIVLMGLAPYNPGSREKVGYLPESHRFPMHLTGLGLLESTGRLYGMSQADIDGRTEELLELVGMDKWANTKIRKYSKGMSQRIGLAQAMMPDPEVLFLDEPTDGVDPIGKIEIRQVLERIKEQGKTVLLNSHLLSEVESVADRVAILTKGRLVRVDSVSNLTNRQSQYEFEAEVGDRLFEVPPEYGKVISLSANRIIAELKDVDGINYIIDQLRQRRIRIRAIHPMKVSLEQSFLELVSDPTSDGGTVGGNSQ